MYFAYIVRCSDNTFYTGYTNDVEARIKRHNGEIPGGAKYTSGRAPVTLEYKESFETKSEAMKREAEIKGYARKEKEELIARDSE